MTVLPGRQRRCSMSTQKIACPACEATLQVTATLPSGKKIRCPKCSEVFAPRLEDAPLKTSIQTRKRAVLPADEVDEDEQEGPAARKKSGKAAKKPAGPLPWLIGGGAVLLIAAGVTLAILFWPSKKEEPVANTGPPPNMPPPGIPMPGQGFPGPGQGFPGPGFPGPGQDNQPMSAGRRVFMMNCARCHQMGPMGRQGRAPSLAKVGADPSHTVEWFTAFIRDPRKVKPDARMPKFEGRIPEEDLKQVAEYLTTLK